MEVDTLVEKLVTKAPGQKPAEQASSEAPTDDTRTAEKVETSSASVKETAEQEELSAFEQELIDEYREDYDALPEGQRQPFLSALKRTYRKQAKQMTELGTLRKAMTALREGGVTNEDLVALIKQKQGGTTAEAKAVVESVKRGFQRYQDKAKSPEEREQLHEAEQVMRETIEDILNERMSKEVTPIKEKLDANERQALTRRLATVEQEIDDLEDTQGWPGAVVETYREPLRQAIRQRPEWTVRQAFYKIAEEKDILLVQSKRSNGVADAEGSGKKLLTTSVVKKSVPMELPRTKRGIISINSAMDLLVKLKPKGR